MNTTKILTAVLISTMLSGCFYNTRPQFTPVEDSVNSKLARRVYEEPITKPQREARAPGSLWQAGSKDFFKDNRARNIGDIVTVIVQENAKAEVDAATASDRTHNGFVNLSRILNLTNKFIRSGLIDEATGEMLNTDSTRSFSGDASTDREDKLEAKIAAMVTEVLPNGYLVIQGQREVLVNYEMQQMTLSGIIRTVDISADNTIPSEKIAEARIAYAGRGMIDEAQETQPAIRFIDKWLPF